MSNIFNRTYPNFQKIPFYAIRTNNIIILLKGNLMKPLILFIATLIVGFTSYSYAAKNSKSSCENMAKSGAIRAYKGEVGEIQGSEGIQYSAELVQTDGQDSQYKVSITDNNEDGDVWTIEYLVTVSDTPAKCNVVKVVKLTE